MTLHPEFSTAEGDVKAGQYAEAVALLRRDIEHYLTEPTPHVRLADLYLETLGEPATIAELQAALAKAKSAAAGTLLDNWLPDLLLAHRCDSAAVVDCFREVQRRCHGIRYATHAAGRATRLVAEQ